MVYITQRNRVPASGFPLISTDKNKRSYPLIFYWNIVRTETHTEKCVLFYSKCEKNSITVDISVTMCYYITIEVSVG